MLNNKKILFILSLFFLHAQAWALPIDWEGFLGFDSTLIDNYRKLEKTNDTSGTLGSQEIPLGEGKYHNASFQSYIFRLNPTILVHDAAAVKAEISTGYPRGGFFGENSTKEKRAGFGNALYFYNTTDSNSTLHLNQLYMDLYSDTATYKIGRHTYHWGMGAIFNSGDKEWQRHSYTRDGLTMQVKISNFHINPYWAKINAGTTLTRRTKMNEYGVGLLYDNPAKDMSVGVHLAKNSSSSSGDGLKADIQNTGTLTPLGETKAKIIDIYFSKKWNKFKIEGEIPIISGEVGKLYNQTTSTKYKTKALLSRLSYQLSHTWSFNLEAGHVQGDDGSEAAYEAMFLNPNFQVAHIMFRYNLRGIGFPQDSQVASLYDSYITNARYLRFSSSFTKERWNWRMAFIYAKALEVAQVNKTAYSHETNRQFNSVANQSDDLGMEIDTDLDFHWNQAVTIGLSFGYHFVGDYYGFANSANGNNLVKDTFLGQIRAGISF